VRASLAWPVALSAAARSAPLRLPDRVRAPPPPPPPPVYLYRFPPHPLYMCAGDYYYLLALNY